MPSRHSGERLASALAKIIAAGAGVGVDEAERRVLAREIDEDAREDACLNTSAKLPA